MSFRPRQNNHLKVKQFLDADNSDRFDEYKRRNTDIHHKIMFLKIKISLVPVSK